MASPKIRKRLPARTKKGLPEGRPKMHNIPAVNGDQHPSEYRPNTRTGQPEQFIRASDRLKKH